MTNLRQLFSSAAQFALFNPCFLLAGLVCILTCLFRDTGRPRLEDPGGPVEMTGWVASPVQRSHDALYFELRPLEMIAAGRKLGSYPGRVAVYVPSRSRSEEPGAPPPAPPEELLFGDIIRIRSDLEEPRFYAVPGVPDHRERLWTRGILHVVHLKSELQITREGTYFPTRPLRPVFRYGLSFESYCQGRFTKQQLVLLLSLFLGRDKSLDDVDVNVLRRLGILHIFVVSGSHISLLLVCLHFALCRLGIAGRLLTLAGIWFYVMLVGLNPPVVRASLMATVFYLLLSLGLSKNFMNVLGISALVLVVATPGVLASSGFQLSYLSLCAIGLFVMPLHGSLTAIAGGMRDLFSDRVSVHRDQASVLRRRTRYALEHAMNFWPHPPGWILMITSECALYTLEVSTCSWFVQLVILPATLWYSNMWLWTQWFSNLVLIPLFGLLVPLYLVLFLTFWTPVGSVLCVLVGFYGDCLLGLLAFLDRFCLVTYLPHPRGWQTLAFLVVLPLLYLGLPKTWRLVAYLVPVWLFLSLWDAHPARPRPGTFTLTMLDVGQGDCIHLSYPSGRSALVDTGGSGDATRRDFIGERVVARYLWEQRIPGLDYVAISHGHRDHVGGLDFLRFAFPIARIYRGPHHPGIDAAITLAAGDRFTVEGVETRVLHPSGSAAPNRDANDESLVLLMRYGQVYVLLTGDIGKATEVSLAPDVPRVDILKAAHHGSRNSNSVEFLEKAVPRLVLISAGRWNPFGHPSPVTLARLDDLGIDWLTTPDSGTIRIVTDGHRWEAAVWDLVGGNFKVIRSGLAHGRYDRFSSPNSPKPFLSSTFLSK